VLTSIGFAGLSGRHRSPLPGSYAEGGFEIGDPHGTFLVRDDGGEGGPALFLPNAGRRGSYELVITRPDGGIFSLVGFSFASAGMHLTMTGSLDGAELYESGGSLSPGSDTFPYGVRMAMVDRLTLTFETGSRGRLDFDNLVLRQVVPVPAPGSLGLFAVAAMLLTAARHRARRGRNVA
jgi:hypothetical protein